MQKPWYNEIRFYHAGISREEKSDVEKWFMGNSEAVLCATCAYGMGVDKADVRTVIHRDCAPSVEAYLQEGGRAGRDGAQSKAILLWGPDDEIALRRAVTEANRSRLERLLHYARDTSRCRRHALLAMLDYEVSSSDEGGGECPESNCCDVCEKQAGTALREEAGLIAFFRKNKRCYTPSEAASVLSSPAHRHTENVHWSEEEARYAVNFLVNTGKLVKSRNIFWKGRLTLR
jgi:ATP-dependent DNA helicase RecQ